MFWLLRDQKIFRIEACIKDLTVDGQDYVVAYGYTLMPKEINPAIYTAIISYSYVVCVSNSEISKDSDAFSKYK